jgi:putative redox protein
MAINIKGNSTDKNFITELSSRDLVIYADEPLDKGGQNKSFTPMELLGSSLSSCTIITLQLYFNHKGWEYSDIEVDVAFDSDIKPIVFHRNVKVKGTFDEKQIQRIAAIANACPVHKLLEKGSEIITNVKVN